MCTLLYRRPTTDLCSVVFAAVHRHCCRSKAGDDSSARTCSLTHPAVNDFVLCFMCHLWFSGPRVCHAHVHEILMQYRSVVLCRTALCRSCFVHSTQKQHVKKCNSKIVCSRRGFSYSHFDLSQVLTRTQPHADRASAGADDLDGKFLSIAKRTKIGLPHQISIAQFDSCTYIQCESKKNPPQGVLTFFHFFHKLLRICYRFFTHLLNVPIFARLRIFIQLSPILTKLCHIKRDYPVHIICTKCPKRAKTRACQTFA